jgi:DnaJ-class molecular chaperone
MIILAIRILVLVSLAAGVVYLLQKILTPSEFVKCGRCEGKGFWYGTREKEICDWCRGSGKIPRRKNQY